MEPHRIRHDNGTDDIRSAETLSGSRNADPKTLNRLLKGDLEQIILMALRKLPRDRYQTVESLMDDLDRLADGQPVRA